MLQQASNAPRLTTFTGMVVNPLALRPEDVDIRDVAHALACINRFCGHVREPISVAQHAVYVSKLLTDRGFAKHGLHHDDAEAFLGDMTKWVKHVDIMAPYRAAEDAAQEVCDAAFGIAWTPDARAAVEWADRLMVRYEFAVGYDDRAQIGHPRYEPPSDDERRLVGSWRPWDWRKAEREFLARHLELVNHADALRPGRYSKPRDNNINWKATLVLQVIKELAGQLHRSGVRGIRLVPEVERLLPVITLKTLGSSVTLSSARADTLLLQGKGKDIIGGDRPGNCLIQRGDKWQRLDERTPMAVAVQSALAHLDDLNWRDPQRVFSDGQVRYAVTEQNGLCLRCGLAFTTDDPPVGDHWFMPWSRGGETAQHNCAALHRKCNAEKGDRTAAEDIYMREQAKRQIGFLFQ